MKAELNWNEKMFFTATADGNQVTMDGKAPIGQGRAMTPKELVAVGLAGCSAMDVAALFKKHKQVPTSFKTLVDVDMSQGGYPQVFTQVTLTYEATGEVSAEVFADAVTLSQTKYCGVSAMLVKSVPINYRVVLNGQLIREGRAEFQDQK